SGRRPARSPRPPRRSPCRAACHRPVVAARGVGRGPDPWRSGVGIVVGEEPAPVDLGEGARVPPSLTGSICLCLRYGAEVEDVDDQQVAWLGTLDCDGPGEHMARVEIDVPDVKRTLAPPWESPPWKGGVAGVARWARASIGALAGQVMHDLGVLRAGFCPLGCAV